MKDRSKRNLTIGILCCLLVFMGVGFAVMNATLSINGTATAINTWSIVIDSITPIVNNDDKNDAKSISTNILDTKTEASFEVEFKKPGDYLEYNVVINNEGSIDGYVESIDYEFITAVEEDNGLFNIEFDDVKGTKITAGESITVKVRVEYKSDATSIPTASVKFTLSANVVQKTQGEVVTPVKTCEEGEINLAGECFHIMYEDDTTYTLLAKYNLLVGNTVVVDENFEPQTITPIDPTTEGYGLQSVDAKGAVFDNTTTWTGTIAFAYEDESRKRFESCTEYGCYYGYWTDLTSHALLETYGTSYPADVYDSNSKLYGHVENYESYLKDQGYNSASARLMTYKEAEDLGCVERDYTCTAAPTWFYTSSYLLGSARDYNNVWNVSSNGYFGYYGFDSAYYIGVRPVITILKSEI